MAQVIVVGAGISGIACARVLGNGGHRVEVLDRGRAPGGRMAVRHRDGRAVDVGASYFTVGDPSFGVVVEDWQRRGLARPWTDTFAVWSPEGEDTKTGPQRWAAADGLRSLVEDLAAGLDVRRERTVEAVDLVDGILTVDRHVADAVVLAMPDPQAARVLSPALDAVSARLVAEYEPVLALTVTFAARDWPDRDGVFVNDHPVLSWIADDGLRRGDRAPVLVAHSTPDFARHHLDRPEAAVAEMTGALKEVLGLGVGATPADASVHRWTYARPAGSRDAPFLLQEPGLGVCGDGWAVKPSVEAAYVSGHRLGSALLAAL